MSLDGAIGGHHRLFLPHFFQNGHRWALRFIGLSEQDIYIYKSRFNVIYAQKHIIQVTSMTRV